MEFPQIVEKAAEIVGGKSKLAAHLHTSKAAITEAAQGKRGLPDAACEKLAEAANMDFGEVIRARMRQRGGASCPFVLMLFALALVTLFVTTTARAAQGAVLQATSCGDIHYASIRAWLRRRIAALGAGNFRAGLVRCGSPGW